MTCPVCFGAFTWKDDLLCHFGAVHHLEELVAHLESEFACETCPPCCRVPYNLFKNLLKEPTGSLPPSKKSSEGTHTDGDGGMELAGNGSPQHKLSSSCMKSIERYHCELCEFSANDIQQLEQHSNEQHSSCHEKPVPLSTDKLSAPVTEYTSTSSCRKQALDKHFCDFCPFSTIHYLSFQRHLNLHKRSASVQVGYKCAYCNVATTCRSSISMHQNASHRGRPIKVLRIKEGRVVKDSRNSGSVSTVMKSKSSSALTSGSVAKKQIKVKMSESEFVAERTTPHTSPKTLTSKQTTSALSVNTGELIGSEKELSTEVLESKFSKQTIYGEPVCCPLCDFSSCARPNLVRHIRLTHASHQPSQTRLVKSCRSSIHVISCANVDPTSLLHVCMTAEYSYSRM